MFFVILFEVLKWVVIVLVVLACILRAIAYYFREHQDNLLYFPEVPPQSRAVVDPPSAWGFSLWDEISIVAKDRTVLHGYFIRQESNYEKAITIVYFHGNAGNIGQRLPLAAALFRTVRCNILMVEYRGYGLSQGIPGEAKMKRDALDILEYARNVLKIERERCVVMGTSLGGAVALHCAYAAPQMVSAVIVENTFMSISAMIDVLFPQLFRAYFSSPWTFRAVFFLARHLVKPVVLFIGWDNSRVIGSITQPILFLSGRKDELVPPFHMHTLHARAKKSSLRVFAPLPNGTHNDSWCCELYFDSIVKFLRAALPKSYDPQQPPSTSLPVPSSTASTIIQPNPTINPVPTNTNGNSPSLTTVPATASLSSNGSSNGGLGGTGGSGILSTPQQQLLPPSLSSSQPPSLSSPSLNLPTVPLFSPASSVNCSSLGGLSSNNDSIGVTTVTKAHRRTHSGGSGSNSLQQFSALNGTGVSPSSSNPLNGSVV